MRFLKYLLLCCFLFMTRNELAIADSIARRPERDNSTISLSGNFTEDEIDDIQGVENGIIKGMCYFLGFIRGSFSRAVSSIFIVVIGACFLGGRSPSLNLKTFLNICLAFALLYGSLTIANVISKNTFSCKYVKLDHNKKQMNKVIEVEE